ncbi:MAG TPA: superoxide dismutase [Cyanobacteria bacterium UBA11049]|nr:superoxide dismutase [Cyanobacteria bacterium UBA11049]
MAFELSPLPYNYDALEPYIDTQTMQLHHDMHHQAYVNNLNTAVGKHTELQSKSLEDLVREINSIPEDVRTAVRNNGGGHVNHTMFWQIMGPNAGGEPTGAIAQVISDNFGDFESFKQRFNDAGTKQFGSGWVWLVRTGSGYEITSTPNQDSPITAGNFPIMGNDVWEHAYYLKYQNKRAEYLKQWWNVVKWDEINKRLETAQ